MPKDNLDELCELVEDLFAVIDDELSAQKWRLNFKPEKQPEAHWLAHRNEMLRNSRDKLRKKLHKIAYGDEKYDTL